MNKISPILFSTEMVQSILDGRKTVTRRIVKLPQYIEPQENGLYVLYADGDCCYSDQSMEDLIDYLKFPCRRGDILYVRETIWQKVGHCLDVGGETKAVFVMSINMPQRMKNRK